MRHFKRITSLLRILHRLHVLLQIEFRLLYPGIPLSQQYILWHHYVSLKAFVESWLTTKVTAISVLLHSLSDPLIVHLCTSVHSQSPLCCRTICHYACALYALSLTVCWELKDIFVWIKLQQLLSQLSCLSCNLYCNQKVNICDAFTLWWCEVLLQHLCRNVIVIIVIIVVMKIMIILMWWPMTAIIGERIDL